MIEINDHRLINLRGKNSSYVLRITETNHLEHIYYGKRLNHVDQSEKAIVEKNLTRALPSLSFDEGTRHWISTTCALRLLSKAKGILKSLLSE